MRKTHNTERLGNPPGVTQPLVELGSCLVFSENQPYVLPAVRLALTGTGTMLGPHAEFEWWLGSWVNMSPSQLSENCGGQAQK